MNARPGAPLAGVRVIEFEGIGPGPLAGRMLADMGAEVTVIARLQQSAVAAQLGGGGDNPMQRGKTVVLITHRSSVIGVTNKLLLLQGGTAHLFGPTAKVLTDLSTASQKPAQPAKPAVALGAAGTTKRAQAGAGH